MTSAPHPFDLALELESGAGRQLRGATRTEWANMVGPFGGITAATLLHAAERHPDVVGDPLALTVNFLAPIADGAFEITPRIVRTNRTNQHWLIELSQGGEPKTTASAVFGIRRDTWSDTELATPVVPGPEDAAPGSFSGMVVWARNYDMRFVTGAMPGVDDGPDPDSTTTVWVRDSRGRAIDYAALTAVCDVFYPRVYLRHGHAVPAGTITLTVYFHADRDQLDAQGADFVLASAHANRYTHGYFDQSAQIWGRDGALLATTHQLVYFKG